jgi:5-methyltetrahydrofolate--homocysteine methyltransferase
MSRFLEALHSGRVLLMDGAMGTQLQEAGLPSGECGEAWNVTQPDAVRAIHQSYVDAGAECLVTNTFQANPAALARHGLHDQLEAINEAALSHARSVRGAQPFILASIGPISAPNDENIEDDPNVLRLVIGTLLTADALLLETWSDPTALMAVPLICKPLAEMAGLPTLLSVTYQRRESPAGVWSFSGHPPEWFAMQAQQWGVAALGVNCGRDIGLDEIIGILRRYRQVTNLPLFARPNAGTPLREGERWRYPLTPARMAERLPELLETGVAMIGGCCGTTPDHIAACRPVVAAWNASHFRG